MKFLFRRNSKIRRIGDTYRNAADWRRAAEAYRAHLDKNPADGPIWVQLGHVEKEAGDFASAEIAYRRAAERMPCDAEVLLHLGHLLKRQSRKADALDTFRALFRIQPDPATLQEIRDLIIRPAQGVQIAGRGVLAFALEDFFRSFEAYATTTGIQRVQAGVVLAAMADPTLDLVFFIGGRADNGAPALFSLDRHLLSEIIAYASGEVVDHPVLQMMLMEARLSAVPLSLEAGSTIVHLGAFWGDCTGIAEYLEPLRRGARLVLFVHDVIPATHPEYCDSKLSRVFWQRLAEMAYAADLIITNSDHTRAELERFMTTGHSRTIPMQTVRLAHAQDDGARNRAAAPAKLPAAVRTKRYVAYVSTIEGRKNHIYVLRAWQRLIEQKVNVPDLVFVGRMGWRVDELKALLADTDYLGRRVHIVHGLSDGELDAVYRGASFTVFSSLAEGWGLPVGESLSRGVPCVAARAGAIPEVGAEFVDYIDPDDLDGGVAVLRRMIENGAYLASRRAAIRDHFVTRTWRDVGAGIIDAIGRHVATSASVRATPPVLLREGWALDPGAVQNSVQPVGDQLNHPMSLELAGSFYEPDPFGAWLRGSGGELTFGTSAEPGETIVVFLKIGCAGWAIGARFSVSIATSRAPRRWLYLSAEGDLIRIEGQVDADRNCTLFFAYDGELRTPPNDYRSLSVALKAIGYARRQDTLSRLDLREQILFEAAA